MPHEQLNNLAEYEGDLDIDTGLLEALIRTTQIVAGRLTSHP